MRSQPVRFSKLRTFVVISAVLAMLAGAGLIATGVDTLLRAGWPAPGAVPLIAAGLAMIAAAVAAIGVTWLLVKIESHSNRQYNQTLDLCDLINKQSNILLTIAAGSRISEATKSITNRGEDREALRGAIREELAREDWEAALNLVEQMEKRFGYQDEAERLREQVVGERTERMRERLNEALQRVDGHWTAFEWDQARQEIERLRRVLPDDKRVARLPEDQLRRREARKKELLAAWEAAVRQTDGLEGEMGVDQAISVLKELDPYLTRDEARQLEESARGVFKAKLVQLGMQFEYYVKDHRWRDALEVGIQITDEFPNSRMAREVQAMEGALRQRAGLSGDVEVTVRPTPAGGG
jgi:hypothetical protein